MAGYLGQVWRSRSWVKGQCHEVKKRFNGPFNRMLLEFIDAFIDRNAKEETKEYHILRFLPWHFYHIMTVQK